MTKLQGSICLSDIPKEYITTGNNGKKYLNIEILEKREPDQWGNTHYVQVDTYKDGKRSDTKHYLGNLKTRSFGNPDVTADTRQAYGITDDDLGF